MFTSQSIETLKIVRLWDMLRMTDADVQICEARSSRPHRPPADYFVPGNSSVDECYAYEHFYGNSISLVVLVTLFSIWSPLTHSFLFPRMGAEITHAATLGVWFSTFYPKYVNGNTQFSMLNYVSFAEKLISCYSTCYLISLRVKKIL